MRTRHHSLGRLHAVVADGLDRRTEDGRRDPTRSPMALRQLARHLDFAEAILGELRGLHELLMDAAIRGRQRAVLGSSAPALADLRRGVASAIRSDRLDQVAECIVAFSEEDFIARSSLTRWRDAHERRDVTALSRIVRDLKRHDLGAVLLAAGTVAARLDGTPVPDALADELAHWDREGEGPWARLARALVDALTESRVAAPTDALPTPATPPKPVRPIESTSNAMAWLPEGMGAVERGLRINKLARDLAALTVDAGTEHAHKIAARIKHANQSGAGDAERAALARSITRHARDALAHHGIDAVALLATLAHGITSNYYGALSQTIASLLDLLVDDPRAPPLRLELAVALRGGNVYGRHQTVGQFADAIAAAVVAQGVSAATLREVCAVVELEASSTHRPSSDFVRFGIGRAAWTFGELAIARRVFVAIDNAWVRGQLLRQAPHEALARLDVSAWLAEITNPLARCFALVRFVRARGPELPAASLDAVFAAARSEYPELLVSAIEALLDHWIRGPEADANAARLWNEFQADWSVFEGDYAYRVVDALARLPIPLDGPLLEWARKVARDASEGRRARWPKSIVGAPSAALPEPREALDIATTDADGQWLAARWRSLSLAGHEPWRDLADDALEALVARVAKAEPTVDTVALLLRFGHRTRAAIDAMAHVHELALALARREVEASDLLPHAAADPVLAEALVEHLAPTPEGDAMLARSANHPAIRGVVRGRAPEYREFDLGRTTALVEHHGRRTLMQLVGQFFDESFEMRAPSRRKPTAQRLCAEAMARWLTREEFDALATRWTGEAPGAAS
jgi:hypothetical protein